MAVETPPTEITLHTQTRRLEIAFADGRRIRRPFEFLRVYSPSAEVQGHGAGQEVLQIGKRDVVITQVDPVGHYAVQPIFSDGHSTGIYSWSYLADIGARYAELWNDYIGRLAAVCASRVPDAPENARVRAHKAAACGSDTPHRH